MDNCKKIFASILLTLSGTGLAMVQNILLKPPVYNKENNEYEIHAYYQGVDAGYISYEFENRPDEGLYGIMCMLFIEEPYRKLGIGLKLFDRLSQICKKEGCAYLWWIALPCGGDQLSRDELVQIYQKMATKLKLPRIRLGFKTDTSREMKIKLN